MKIHYYRYIGDHIGRLNANILFTMISGVSSLTIWVFAYNYGTLMAFAAVFGLVCSSYVALRKLFPFYFYLCLL